MTIDHSAGTGAHGPAANPPSSAPRSNKRSGLATLLDQADLLSPAETRLLQDGMKQGLSFYHTYNESRLKLALSCFDKEMKNALFELLFLLHVNDPRLEGWKFKASTFETRNGRRVVVESVEQADLYLEGAPSGVRGIKSLSPLLQKEYEQYIEGKFRMPPYGNEAVQDAPIVVVQSVGSIGTVGHKSIASDLDLQVIYDLDPFVFDTKDWDNNTFKDALNREHKWWINHFRKKQNIALDDLKDKSARDKLSGLAARQLSRIYPGLYNALVSNNEAFIAEVLRADSKALRHKVLQEIFALMKRADRLSRLGELRKREELLKQRITRIQEYINAKFPTAEVYLFVYTVEGFRKGRYSSSLEFKESSGSAYELILNYETLMPGIQFTPMVPTHFVMPAEVNNNTAEFDRFTDMIRFQSTNLFNACRDRLVDLGTAPDLDIIYVAEHGHAIYWEAFKASSGNLPKATLNLLRFEMLLDERFIKTIIQIIKTPKLLDTYVSPRPENQFKESVDLGQMKIGMPTWAILEMEAAFPDLLYDPWWLRYKALKIAFVEAGGIPGISAEERNRLSVVIDLAFCLHLRVSDVLDPDGETIEAKTYRDRVMADLLNRGFPAGSPRRINLQNLFSGGLSGLIFFENELRDLFKSSMTRVEQTMAALNVREHAGEKKEVDLWLNYYIENFQPQQNTVPRVIMKHIKSPRPGIEISYEPGAGWAFRSLQKLPNLDQRLPPRKVHVSYLPDRVLLLDRAEFLTGLAHCIMNGYYGNLAKPSEKPVITQIFLQATGLDLGNNIHNTYAMLDTDQITALAKRITQFFGYMYIDYKDIINVKRKVIGVFVCLNLFKFGELSILYRDNMNTWYADVLSVPGMFDNALHINKDPKTLINHGPMLAELSQYLRKKQVDTDKAQVAAWVNPNSITPDRTQNFYLKARELEEGGSFKQIILSMPE